MTIKKIISQKLVEAVGDSIFDTGISKEELRTRRISVERVIRKINEAIKKATSSGNTEALEQLNSELEFYQHLYDHAEDYGAGKSGESSGGSETPSGDSEDSSPDSSLTGDLESTEDSEDFPDEAENADSGKDSDSGESEDSTEDDSTESAEDSEDTPAEGKDSDSEESEEETDSSSGSDNGEDTEDSEEDEEKTGTGTESKEDEDLFSDDEKGEGDSEDGEEDGKEPDEESDLDSDKADDGSEGSEGAPESEEEDPMNEPDDYPPNPKPIVKDGKILIDPFKNRPASMGMEDMPSEMETETTFEAASRILGKLYGDARDGALAGLKEILKSRGYTESLHAKQVLTEKLPTKTLREYSEEELSDLIRNTMSIVDKVVDVDYSDDIEDRAKELEKIATDPVARIAMDREDSENVKKDAKKASDSENAAYARGKKLGGLSEFTRSLYQAIADQVEDSEEDEESWAALDRRHEDDPSIIKKGIIRDDVPNEEIPSINVYFDQSGSWSNEEVEIGKRAISTINEFHERGEIKLNIFYMSAGGVFTTSEAARAHPGAEGWADALQHIKDTKVKNVIVLSDRDLDHFEWSNRPTGDNGVTYVEGCVWWLWKNGSVSNKALKELIGGKSNYAYSFPCR